MLKFSDKGKVVEGPSLFLDIRCIFFLYCIICAMERVLPLSFSWKQLLSNRRKQLERQIPQSIPPEKKKKQIDVWPNLLSGLKCLFRVWFQILIVWLNLWTSWSSFLWKSNFDTDLDMDQGRNRSIVRLMWAVWSPVYSDSWSVSAYAKRWRIEESLLCWYCTDPYFSSVFFMHSRRILTLW